MDYTNQDLQDYTDYLGDVSDSLMLTPTNTVTTPGTTPSSPTSGSWFSSLTNGLGSLTTTAAGITNALQGKPVLKTPAQASASNSMAMYLIIGAAALLLFMLMRKK